MVNEIFPGIYVIPVPLPDNPLKLLNAYLIKGDSRHLLIDTGFNHPDCLQALTRAFQQLKVPVQQLDIFITHLHSDHCGLAGEFPPSETRTIWASKEDAEAINLLATESELWHQFMCSWRQHGCDEETITALQTNHPGKKYAPTQKTNFTLVKEGDTLQYGGYNLQVLDVPGHTPGHLALYIPEKKILFGGDLILQNITPNISYWETMDDALASYFNSLNKVSRLDIACTLPGHRAVIHDTQGRIAELKKHYVDRLEETCTILASGGAMTATDVASKMQWHIKYDTWKDIVPAQRWFAINEALSHLEHLVNTGRVSKQERDGVIYFIATPHYHHEQTR